MREAVPAHLPVSVKCVWAGTAVRRNLKSPMRFNGWCYGAGSTWADKRAGLPRGHIDWQAIGEIRQRLNIPVIATVKSGTGRVRNNAWRSAAARSDDWSRGAQYSQPEPCGEINEPRMPWPEVVALLQKYTRRKSRAIPGYITLRGLNSG